MPWHARPEAAPPGRFRAELDELARKRRDRAIRLASRAMKDKRW